MKLKASLKAALFGATLTTLAAGSASAEVVDVKITNLTQGIYFTPILLAAHDADSMLFQIGEQASVELAMMAEGGAIDGLYDAVKASGGEALRNPAEGLLAPAATTMATDFDSKEQQYLSIVAMMLPTNDGFIGLNSWPIPSEPGDYVVYLDAYDAGTEANDEIVNGGGMLGAPGIPVNPGMNGGTGGSGVTTEESNDTVHIHRGVLGDTDADAGPSDLDSRVHRWLNPVAKVVISVK
ncbi:spondin domain-containing protein [Agaribacterium haliotis]|uniref:spondin domain-containing protein n=1 Tax=Agaribacterium haliotis TaxID=2013869 RepID=UPI000BB56204|nr:spondin domain-containing protein [Agaribacterium haliotis]